MQCSGPAIAHIPKMLWCFTSTSANLPFPQRFLFVTAPKLVIKTMNLITFRVTFLFAFLYNNNNNTKQLPTTSLSATQTSSCRRHLPRRRTCLPR